MSTEFRRHSPRLFAVLRTIVRRSADGLQSKGDYAAPLEGRIDALSRVQDMPLRAPAQGVDGAPSR